MMKRLTLALAFLAAGPATAQSEAEVDALVTAIAAGGCVVSETNEAEVLAASGLTEDAAAAVVMVLMTSGQAVPEGDDLRLVSGPCG